MMPICWSLYWMTPRLTRKSRKRVFAMTPQGPAWAIIQTKQAMASAQPKMTAMEKRTNGEVGRGSGIRRPCSGGAVAKAPVGGWERTSRGGRYRAPGVSTTAREQRCRGFVFTKNTQQSMVAEGGERAP